MRKGVIGLSLETLVIIVFGSIVLVMAIFFISDFFFHNLNFLNNTVPR